MSEDELKAVIAKTERGLDQVLTAEGMAEIARDALRFRHVIKGADHFPDPEPRPGAPISWGWSVQWGCWTHQGADIRAAIDATMTAGS